MKRNSFIYGAGAILLALASCSSFDDAMQDDDGLKNPKNITVSTYIGPNTRAMDKTTFVEGDELGLFACRTTGKYAGSFSANFMDNVKVTKGVTDWTYSPLMAWPTDANEHLTFVAYYPYSAASSATEYPFTVDLDYRKQTDPLYCVIQDANINDRNGTSINGDPNAAAFEATSGSLPLKFQHMLSKVNVSVKLSSDYPGITAKLKKLEIGTVYKTGYFSVNTQDLSVYWSTSGDKYNTFQLFSDEGEAEPLQITSSPTPLAELLMIPQDLSKTKSAMYITYTHTLLEGGEKEVTKKLMLPDSWKVNTAYNYVINLDLDVNTITISTEVGNFDGSNNPGIGNQSLKAVDLGLSVKWATTDYEMVDPNAGGVIYTNDEKNRLKRNSEWGSEWSIPTDEQWNELNSNCNITSEIHEGKIVYKATLKNDPNKYIILGSSTYWSDTYNYPYQHCVTVGNQIKTSNCNDTYHYGHPIRLVRKN